MERYNPFWIDKKVLLTGGSGFLGQHIVKELTKVGCKMIYIPPSYTMDLMDYDAVQKVTANYEPDIVIHSAALYGGIMINKTMPEDIFYKNTIMGANLFHALCKLEKKPKVVAIGTACFAPGTPVVVKGYGVKNIEDVDEDDLVLTSSGFNKVLQTTARKAGEPCVEVRAGGIEPITCTKDHEFLTFDGSEYKWINAGDLKCGDILVGQLPTLTKTVTKLDLGNSKYETPSWRTKNLGVKPSYIKELFLDEDWSYLFGVFLAEGYCNNERGYIELNPGFNKQFISNIEDSLKAVGLKYSVRKMRTSIRLVVYNKHLCEMLFSQFYNSDVHKAHTKIIPEFIYSLPNSYKIAFIRGYCDGDGCLVTTPSRCKTLFTSVSHSLIYQLKYLLSSFGILGSIKYRKTAGQVYIEDRLVNQRDSWCLVLTGYNDKLFRHHVYDGPLPGKDVLRYNSQAVHTTEDSKHLLCPVTHVSVTDYEGYVYNLEVDTIPSYSACGITAHNCSYPGQVEGEMSELSWWDGPCHPSVDNYGPVKKMMYLHQKAAYEQHGLEGIHLILTNLYGPGDSYNPDRSHVVAALIRKFVEAKLNDDPVVQVWGTGKPVREFLYVEDCARAVVKAAECCNYYDTPINIGTGIGTSIAELADVIVEAVGFKGDLLYEPDKPDGALMKVLDISHMRETLGWEPNHSLKVGIEKTVDWYIKNKEEADKKW